MGFLSRFARQSSDAIVHGTAFVTMDAAKSALGSDAANLARTNAAKAAQITLPNGQKALPLAMVTERAAAKGVDISDLARIDADQGFRDLASAGRRYPHMTSASFAAAVDDGEIPSLFVRFGNGTIARMVPESVLPAASTTTATAGAASGAAQLLASGHQAVGGVREAARGFVAGKGARDVLKGVGGGAAILGVGAALYRLSANDSSQMATVSKAVQATPSASADAGKASDGEAASKPSAEDAAKQAKADKKAADAIKAEEAKKAAEAAKQAAAARKAEAAAKAKAAHQALVTKIVDVAKGEVGAREKSNASGKITSSVKKYFSTTSEVKAKRGWKWPGYFVAWVRKEAGAPIAPGKHWMVIDQLVAKARKDHTWAGRSHKPQAGDVVVYKSKGKNRAAIVTGAADGKIKLVDPYVKRDGAYEVVNRSMSSHSSAIVGYIKVPKQ